MRTRGQLKAGAVGTAMMLLMCLAPASAGAVQVPRAAQTISSGVTFKVISRSGPNKVHVLTIDPTKDASIDVGLARPNLPGYARPSDIGTSRNAVAAVNGDFGLSPGRPGHLYAEDGELVQTTLLGTTGKNFAIAHDESKAYVGNPDVRITAYRASTRETWDVAKWNVGVPGAQTLAGYSVSGGSAAPTPKSSCSVRLMQTASYSWAPNRSGVTKTYSVDAVSCGSSNLALNGGVVLAAQTSGNGADRIRSLSRGETVQLTWSLGWSGVVDSIGGSPVLLQNGKVMVDPCSDYLCRRHPRTAIGVTSSGKILLVVVDGRQSGYSVGMTLVQLANEMKNLGAVDAMNLDGGGSSAMWIRGRGIVNRPSDGSERSVSSAVLVLPNGDSGDPSMARPQVVPAVAEMLAPVSPVEQQAAMQDAVDAAYSDPASTGGLLEYGRG